MNNRISERRIRNNKLKRKHQLRRNISMTVITFVLIACFSVMFCSFGSKAQSSSEDISYKYYKSIAVGAGDTLWDYARLYADENHYDTYNSYIKEVKDINHLKDDNIVYGQYIVLPYYSNEFVG